MKSSGILSNLIRKTKYRIPTRQPRISNEDGGLRTGTEAWDYRNNANGDECSWYKRYWYSNLGKSQWL